MAPDVSAGPGIRKLQKFCITILFIFVAGFQQLYGSLNETND